MKLRTFLLLIVMLALSSAASAQISDGGTPPSFLTQLDDAVPTIKLPPVDVAAYLAEDAVTPKDVPMRFGAPHDIHYDLKNSGRWSALPDGGRVWRLRFLSAGAHSLNLLYDRFQMPKGAKLFLYSDDQKFIIGAFTELNHLPGGGFATQPVPGDAIILEYYEPADVAGQGELAVSRVVHAYRNLFGRGHGSLDYYGEAGACNVNINCAEGASWQSEKRGVAMILNDGGSRHCTGSLVNNVRQNQTPYFLTARHCTDDESVSLWVFLFNYESPTCTNADGPTTQSVTGSTLLATNAASDFSLLQLSSNVPSAYTPYFNGWNNVNSAAANTICIHHPSGDIKKISFDNDAPVSDRYLGYSGTANSHWKVVDWDVGTTEGGSSGSPLFDQNHRIVGQLHGGYAACGNNSADWYGKFSMSWSYGGTSSTQLSNWLDPDNTGATTLNGYEPVYTTITVTAPNGGETWIVGDSYNITWTSTGLSENVKIEINRSYSGGAWETIIASTANDGTHPWTVTGSATAAARIRISGVTQTTVTDVSDANFSVGVRTVAVVTPNNGETWIVGDSYNITWTSQNLSENVKIELNRNFPGTTWETIIASTTNDGAHPWTVTGAVTSTARVRISGVTHTAVSDTSNANFTIAIRSVTLTQPNSGESWYVNDVDTIKWTSQNLTGNVKIELNRSYPGTTWETIIAGTANSGSYPWTVTGPTTAAARVRISGVAYPAVSDTSNVNFSIGLRTLIVASPNGGEIWQAGDSRSITWTSQNLPGNVKIELDRNYPVNGWETIVSSTSNTGSYLWLVTSPATAAARVRIVSVNYSTVRDTSNADFTILPANQSPAIAHDPLHDQGLAAFPVTAIVTDDAPGFTSKLFYRPAGGVFDSLSMAATGNPDEYAGSLGPLTAGYYDYFLRATDIVGLAATTDTCSFWVGESCSPVQVYDDGAAEASHWSEHTGYRWAVKFEITGTPFLLCNAQIGISAVHPDENHSAIVVEVLDSDGPGGLPGTVLFSRTAGSIGNVIGGVPVLSDNFTPVLFRDGLGGLPEMTRSFYVAVGNPEASGFEAFLTDTNSVRNGRSFVYDPCDSTWLDELAVHASARPGNRMIRVGGFSPVPPEITVALSGNDMRLDWIGTGAPYYRIYSAAAVNGAFTTLEGSTSGNSFIDVGAAAESMKFYTVRASTTP